MKTKATLSIIFFAFLISTAFAQDGVGIGTDNPNEKAILHIQSSGAPKGLMIPRYTTTERNTINPGASADNEAGLIIYNTDTDAYNYWDGMQWLTLVPFPANLDLDMNNHRIESLADAVNSTDATNKGQVEQLIADSQRVVLGGYVDSNGNVTSSFSPIGSFTISKSLLGVYNINHNLNYQGLIAMATPDFPDHVVAVDRYSRGPNYFRILVRNHDNNLVDGGFFFVAFMP